MTQGRNYDFLIIGGGIVGLSIAKELCDRHPTASIAVIEKEGQMGRHASGRNSGVLHSGIYYPQDSLKAKVCAEGARRMMAFAKEEQIPCSATGKVIIATKSSDLPTIDFLLRNAANNKLRAERLDEQEIRAIEPFASPYECGIFTPDTASIDSKKVLIRLSELLLARGVKIYLQQEAMRVELKTRQLYTKNQHFSYGYLFNAAGSGTDKIAKWFGLAKDYTLLPFKGIYYQLAKDKNYLVKSNIYPVPDLNLPFLGVHFTKTISGDVYVGPTAIPAFGRENYGLLQGIHWEGLRIMKDIAFMYFANQQHFRTLLHTEMRKYMKSHFIRSARQLISVVQPSDLLPTNKVGIRPQLINKRQRKIEMDYIIEQDEYSMHVLNAISPAFTGAFCFAELLVKRMENKFVG